MKKIIVNILFLIALAMTVNAQSTDSSILVPSPFNLVTTQNREVSTAIALGAGEYWLMPLPDEGEIFARFRTRGGSKNDVEVYILDSDGLENWRNGHTVSTYYNSKRATVGNINVRLGKGKFYLVVSNTFSIISSKAVTLTFYEKQPN